MKEILAYLSLTYGKLNASEREFVLQNCDEMTIPKGDTLLKEGEFCEYIWFVKKGMLVAFQTEPEKIDGRGVCTDQLNWIMTGNDCATSVLSFFFNLRSLERIVAHEETVVFRMSKKALFEGIERFHQLSLLTMRVILKYYGDTRFNETYLRMKRPEFIYQRLLESENAITQRVPDSMLMTFLGVTRPTLIKIKGSKNQAGPANSPKPKKKK